MLWNYWLHGKNIHKNTIVNIGKVHFGDGNLTAIAGPCTIESKEQLFAIAEAVKASGADLLGAAHINQELLPILPRSGT